MSYEELLDNSKEYINNFLQNQQKIYKTDLEAFQKIYDNFTDASLTGEQGLYRCVGVKSPNVKISTDVNYYSYNLIYNFVINKKCYKEKSNDWKNQPHQNDFLFLYEKLIFAITDDIKDKLTKEGKTIESDKSINPIFN